MSEVLSLLRDELADLNDLIEATDERAAEADNAFPYELSRRGLVTRREHLLELVEEELQRAQIAELSIQWDGRPVVSQQVEAGFLADFLGRLQDLMDALGQAIGSEPTRRGAIRGDIIGRTRLRVASTFAGSFGIRLVGHTAPDLFGESLIEDCFTALHEVIDARDTVDDLAPLFARYGPRVQSHYSKFLGTVANNGVDVIIGTHTDTGERRQATLEHSAARDVRQALVLLEREERRTERRTGRLIGLRQQKQDFEFLDLETEEIITGNVRAEALPDAVAVFDERIAATFLVESIMIRGTEDREDSWTLAEIGSILDEEGGAVPRSGERSQVG